MLSDRDIVDHIRRRLPEVVAVYRFGSSGTPHERPDSDLDLAVLTRFPAESASTGDAAPSPVRLWEVAQELAARLGRDVDIVDLRRASTVMRAQVVAHGRRLWSVDPGVCERFEDFVYSSYARLNEERRGILEDIRRRGSIHAG